MKTLTLIVAVLAAATASAATLPVAEDSYGYRAKLTIAANKASVLPVDATHRAFVYFNLGDLPPGASLRYARLRLYLPSVTRVGGGLAVHQVTGTWDESLTSAEPSFNPAPLTTLPASGLGKKRFISVDVTAAVTAWIAAPASNEGFVIAAIPGATAALTASVTLGAKEGSGSGYPAELDVEIADDPVAAGAIGSAQLAAGAVQPGNIASGAVSESSLGDGSVTTPKLAIGAVTDEKIATVSGAKVSGAVANSATVDGIGVSAAPMPNSLLPLDAAGKFPGSVLPQVSSSNLASDLILAGTTTGNFVGNGAGLTNVPATIADGAITFAKLEPSILALLNYTPVRPLEFVTVGDAGNPADTTIMTTDATSGFGSVAYSFQIGKFEVTNEQYTEFLNAVAATDPNGLYDSAMGTGLNGGIFRNGASGSFVYSAKSAMRLRPVVYVTWFDAIRFCNWLHNSMPVGTQGPSTTESGAYTISAGNVVGPRNAAARYFLPTENEWYKAAYFDPAKVGGAGYWLFPSRSDLTPTATQPTTAGANSANFAFAVNEVTAVGSYGLSASSYGTFDQGGNVYEWNETIVSGAMRGLRGGGWNDTSAVLESTNRNKNAPSNFYSTVGFRVAKP